MNIKNLLSQSLISNGYHFSIEQQNQFSSYLDLLQRWNKVFNLTAIHDPEDLVMLHILDSLSIHPYLHGTRIIDVGSGAGLPGIPLAIQYPEKFFTLLDSNGKKTRFLTQVKNELKLQNVEIIHARCEDYQPGWCFDTIVSRAFASIKVMLEVTQHLICADGYFLAMKGIYPEKELAEISPEFKVMAVHKLKITGLEAERCVVSIVKD